MNIENRNNTFFEKIDSFFRKYRWIIIIFSLIITSIFTALLFEFKVSIGGDDSTYILSANNFIRGVSFPDWHGAFYPIFLSFFLKIFGLKLILFKFLSFVMIVVHLFLFYLTFRKRVSWAVLLLTILFLSVCSELLYFGSQTYSEALFLLLQILVFASFYRICDSSEQKENGFFNFFGQWIFFGLSMFLLVITRNIGWIMLFSAILYFVIIKQYKKSIKTAFSFLVFYIPFFIYKVIFWGTKTVGLEGQFGKMFWLNPYDRNEGLESFGGFIKRFFVNSEQYLSTHLLNIFSWSDTSEKNILFTIVVYLILAFSGFIVAKRVKQLLFPYIYLVLALVTTFFSQQIMWNQLRLVLVFVPFIVMIFAESLWKFSEKKKFRILKIAALVFLFSLIIPSTIKTINRSKKHFPVLKANMQGNKFYGFSEDWKNYLKMTEWVASNIPEKSVVACRKPGMAFIYSQGRTFAGIYTVPTIQIDEVFGRIEKQATTFHFFIDFQIVGDNLFALYPYFYYISTIINKSDGRQFITFSIDEKNVHTFYSAVTTAGINPLNLDDMKVLFAQREYNDYAVYPDSLLNFLQNKDIDYLIMAHLRMKPDKKTNLFITTIHRYIYFIEMKYPGIFDIVWQIGDDNDENSVLIKIDKQKITTRPVTNE